MGQIQVVFSRDRQIERPHQGHDRIVALATMAGADSARHFVDALPRFIAASPCCSPFNERPGSRRHLRPQPVQGLCCSL
jgi:hypothetical protein